MDLPLERGKLPANTDRGGIDGIICCNATRRREAGTRQGADVKVSVDVEMRVGRWGTKLK